MAKKAEITTMFEDNKLVRESEVLNTGIRIKVSLCVDNMLASICEKYPNTTETCIHQVNDYAHFVKSKDGKNHYLVINYVFTWKHLDEIGYLKAAEAMLCTQLYVISHKLKTAFDDVIKEALWEKYSKPTNGVYNPYRLDFPIDEELLF